MKRFNIGTKYEYCPNGNYWQDVSGIFDRYITLFCDCPKCNGQFYSLRPINITKKITPEQIEKIRKWNKVDDVREAITAKNVDEFIKILDEKL